MSFIDFFLTGSIPGVGPGFDSITALINRIWTMHARRCLVKDNFYKKRSLATPFRYREEVVEDFATSVVVVGCARVKALLWQPLLSWLLSPAGR